MSLRARSTKSSYFESPDASEVEDAPKRKKAKSTPKRKRNDDTEASDTDVAPKPKAKKPRQSSKKSSPRKKKAKVESDEEEYNSDDLDDDLPKPKRSPKKRTKAIDDDDDGTEVVGLKAGQKVVGVVIEAPKSGQVPAGQISKNTLDFLQKLQDPKCNDREWFKLHDSVYRQAEKEWKDFVDAFTDVLTGVDPDVPPLPPKDLIHRIYRDVRFSNDKTPYKTNFSASFSRSGRKGIFACYHISIKPGGGSLLAAGLWCPGKNELNTIRNNIQRDPQPLRDAISCPDFVKYFGEPKHASDGSQQNIFGSEDELKVAPKGIDKNHQDIDLLKCRSFAVIHRFLDTEVLDSSFKDTLGTVAGVVRPFVHCLNDMITIAPDNDGDD